LCFGSPRLFTASDIFSVGQIFAHCLLTKPLIPSHNDEDHIVRMLLLLGLPTLSEIQDMELEALDATGPSKHNRIPYAQILYDHLSVLIPRETIPACSWCQNIPFRHMVGHQSFDLIERMLTWSPKHRIKASSALSHSFFQDHDS
jgi:serine/threonine protein kinase